MRRVLAPIGVLAANHHHPFDRVEWDQYGWFSLHRALRRAERECARDVGHCWHGGDAHFNRLHPRTSWFCCVCSAYRWHWRRRPESQAPRSCRFCHGAGGGTGLAQMPKLQKADA